MDIETVFIKSEPQDECLDSPDIFQHDTSQNITEIGNPVKVEVKSDIDNLTKSFYNEESHETTTSVLCKDEPEYFFNSDEISSKCSKFDAEEDNKMNILKIESLNQDEDSWDSMKQEEEHFDIKSESSDNQTDLEYKIKQETEDTNIKEQISKKSSCQFCGKPFITKRWLDNHMLKQHLKLIKSNIKYFISSKIHSCKVCFYQTTHKTQLDRHVNSTHNKERSKPFSCQFCDKSLVTKILLDNHLLKHSKEMKGDIKNFISSKIYSCKDCLYQTTRKSQLDRHINSMHNKQKSKQFSCQFCDKSVLTKRSLDSHMVQQHLNEMNGDMKEFISNKIHTCKVCGYQTSLKVNLDRHAISMHNDHSSKQFSCQVCDKSVVTKRSLDNHMLQQHSKEATGDMRDSISTKVHTCELCSYQTTYKTQLDAHVTSMHNEETCKKFSCQFCDKSLLRKQSLDNHILKQHSKEINNDLISYKIHTCNACSYQTTHKTQLDRHINSIHHKQRSEQFLCQFCDKLLVSKRSLDNHHLKRHKDEIKDNMREFISYKIHTCSFCSYQTAIKSDLARHVNSMHKK